MIEDQIKKQFCQNISMVAAFGDKLLNCTRLENLAALTVNTVGEAVNASQVGMLIFDLEDFALRLECWQGITIPRDHKPRLDISGNVSSLLNDGWEILGPTLEEKEKFYLLHDPDLERYVSVEFRIPVFLSSKTLAVLLLGKKESGMDDDVEEFDLMRIIGNLLVMHGHSSFRHQGQKEQSAPVSGFSFYRKDDYSEILGESLAIRRVINIVDRVAGEDVPVLITGESGTGKELIARAVHRKSKRNQHSLVAMNCAALPDTLVESELFGHEKGAFTSAGQQKKGKFEFAHESTLFLDEIGDMSLATQAKLLRVLQDGSLQRIGGNETIRVDVRFVAATNKDLHTCIEKGEFRQDLYYRVNVVQIEMPPLRSRREDIPLLAEHFFSHYNDLFHKNLSGLHDEVVEWMQEYAFPGNVRELKNMIERAVILETEPVITLSSILHNMRPGAGQKSSKKKSLEEIEKSHIEQVLRETNYNKSAAARLLGIARKTLREKMEKYHLS